MSSWLLKAILVLQRRKDLRKEFGSVVEGRIYRSDNRSERKVEFVVFNGPSDGWWNCITGV